MAKFRLSNPYDKKDFVEYVNRMLDKGYDVDIHRVFPGRTNLQNRYLHACLGFFASEFGYSIEEVKYEIFKKKCNKDLFERTRENKRGDKVTYLRSSADLSTAEMTTAIERFRNYSAAEANLYIPAPNDENFIFYAEQQMEKMKEWI